MDNITWLGSRTILYKGQILELDGCEDGWAAVRAIERAEREEKERLKGLMREIQAEERRRG